LIFPFSYTWSFEKINLSMALVITGQLVGSYDEEFRRLYARSMVPTALSSEKPSVQYLRDIMALHSPSMHKVHMRSKVTRGMRSAHGDRLGNAAGMTRGLSVQDRLNQSHCFDAGNLMRGHSYAGELQKLHSLTRPRGETNDVAAPFAPEKAGPNPRGAGDLLLPNRSHQHLRHQTRYGADQNLIPFNSETSLNRWKMDAYFNQSDVPLDASCDTLASVISPYGSHTGLNEHQAQPVHNRPHGMKSRLDEMRQKRLSLQDYSNLKQSQESLRSVYQPLERPQQNWVLDTRQSAAEFDPNAQNGYGPEPSDPKDGEPTKEVDQRQHPLTDDQRSASHYDVASAPDRRKTQTYDWHQPLTRTTSAADFDMTLNDPSLKLSHLQPGGLQHPRALESLTEIPEEKGDGSRVNSSDSAAFRDEGEEVRRDGNAVLSKEDSVESAIPADSQCTDEVRGSLGSVGTAANGSDSAAPQERQKSNELPTVPKILNPSAGSQLSLQAKSSQAEKIKAQRQEPPLLRKSSLRKKVASLLLQDEKKVHKKDEKSSPQRKDEKSSPQTKDEKSSPQTKDETSSPQTKDEKSSLQRKASVRSQSSSTSNQVCRADRLEAPEAEQPAKRGPSPTGSRSQASPGGPAETSRSPFTRSSSQRSSKKKMSDAAAAAAAEQGEAAAAAAAKQGEAAFVYRTRKTKVYSRFEYLLSTEVTGASASASERDGRSSLNRNDSAHQAQSGADNKLGRFMQRVGNLMGKK